MRSYLTIEHAISSIDQPHPIDSLLFPADTLTAYWPEHLEPRWLMGGVLIDCLWFMKCTHKDIAFHI